jgi:hypothetical protein
MLAVTGTGAHAQNKTIEHSDTTAKRSHWVAGTTYQSDDVYLGRKDSVSIPYITPSIGYHDKSGLFITGSASYLPGKNANRIDVATIEGGYSYTSDKFNAEFSAAKDFYSDQSFAVTSAIKGRLSASLSYDFGPIEPSMDLGAEFSDNADIGVTLGLGHSFEIIEDHFEVAPTFHVNAATQNFYGNYFSKRRYSAKRSGTNSNIVASIASASKLQLMDYEFEATFEYTIDKKLKLNFTPTLAIPVNPMTITLTDKSTGGNKTARNTTENLNTTFFFSLGFAYTF